MTASLRPTAGAFRTPSNSLSHTFDSKRRASRSKMRWPRSSNSNVVGWGRFGFRTSEPAGTIPEACGEKTMAQVTPDEINAFLDEIPHPATRNDYRKEIVMLWHFCRCANGFLKRSTRRTCQGKPSQRKAG